MSTMFNIQMHDSLLTLNKPKDLMLTKSTMTLIEFEKLNSMTFIRIIEVNDIQTLRHLINFVLTDSKKAERFKDYIAAELSLRSRTQSK